jgi:hypothetical protein
LLESFESSEDLKKGFQDGRVSEAQYQKIVDQMIENNAARSLINPRIMVGDKFVESSVLTDFFLMKRDYDSAMLLKMVSPEEMLEVLVSNGNVFNYTYGQVDCDGYGIPQARTTEIYYNPYLCRCEVDADRKVFGNLDRIRMEAYRTLASSPNVRSAWINTRLPASQMQFCLRRYLEGGVDAIELIKGKAHPEIIKELKLKSKEKPAVEGRRPMDLVGFYDAHDQEVEVVVFYSYGKISESIAFYKSKPKGAKTWLAAYSKGSIDAFYKTYEQLGVQELLKV